MQVHLQQRLFLCNTFCSLILMRFLSHFEIESKLICVNRLIFLQLAASLSSLHYPKCVGMHRSWKNHTICGTMTIADVYSAIFANFIKLKIKIESGCQPKCHGVYTLTKLISPLHIAADISITFSFWFSYKKGRFQNYCQSKWKLLTYFQRVFCVCSFQLNLFASVFLCCVLINLRFY